MKNSLKYLEFNIIKDKVVAFANSQKAYLSIGELIPSTDYDFILKELNLTSNILNIIVKYGKIPFIKDFDIVVVKNKDFLERVYYLEEFLYLRLFLEMEKEINEYFDNTEFFNYYLDNFHITNNSFILTELNKVFSADGNIYDDASIELKKVRTKIKSLEFELTNKLNGLLKKYESYLSDNQLVIRNGRYCLSIKDSYKNKVSGVIHDVSNSGLSVFIEPEVSLTYHNLIEIEQRLEKKEIEKILIKLTSLINENYFKLHYNLINFIKLDIIHAKALYSKEIDGILPNINKDGILKLVNAKHPLINKNDVVPISLELNNDKRTLLITGPNTGGKTVSLKTTGLLTVMMQSGILVPVDYSSNMNVFDNIFVDIGDEQSILNSLSTFSSHIAKIITYLNNLTNNSLVLLDELGSGTDPIEGVALAIAIIEEFEKKNVKMIVTSHFSELKTYALEKENTLTASVAFDKDSLKPLYYLKHGISGDSHARLIAKRLGMNSDVLNRANEIFSSRESDISKLMKKLENELELSDKLKNELKIEIKNYKEKEQILEEEKLRLINEQNNLLEKIRIKEEKRYRDKLTEIDLMLEKIENDSNIKLHDIAELKRLKNDKITKTEIYNKELILKKGDQVYIKSYGQHGTIYDVKNDLYYVKFGIFDLPFKLKDLTKVNNELVKETKKTIKKTKNPIHDFDTSSKLEVDLRGLRYEEVSVKLDKAIDRALLSNIKSLTIIHGFGTFAVKKAVDEYIRKSNLIKSKRSGKEGEGLGGVTIITFK